MYCCYCYYPNLCHTYLPLPFLSDGAGSNPSALQKFRQWMQRKSPVEVWADLIRNAEAYEDWEEAALHLDNLLGLDLWRNNPTSPYYDYRLINERLARIVAARDEGSVHALVNLLRSGLVRNLGNITAPKLYNRSFAGTKFLIEEYVTQVAEAIEDIGSLPTLDGGPVTFRFPGGPGASHHDYPWGAGGSSDNGDAGPRGGNPWERISTQMKLDFVHDTRQAFGRTTLVLQGGAIFGLCHLGVAKALFLRGLLPRIITGTATGALIAALVAIHNEEELPAVLQGDGIDLSAFAGKDNSSNNNGSGNNTNGDKQSTLWTRWNTLVRRARRFRREGYFLDVKVLEECVRTNVGDLTFEEAYNRSKRVLNITVATAGQDGVPTLLNYLTAPNVVRYPMQGTLTFSTSPFLPTIFCICTFLF